MRADGLSKIRHLKLLKLEDLKFSGSLNHLSNELAYLNWREYPFKCLPQSFQPEKLVELYLVGSRIKRLWEGTKVVYINFLFFLNKSIKSKTLSFNLLFSLNN